MSSFPGEEKEKLRQARHVISAEKHVFASCGPDQYVTV